MASSSLHHDEESTIRQNRSLPLSSHIDDDDDGEVFNADDFEDNVSGIEMRPLVAEEDGEYERNSDHESSKESPSKSKSKSKTVGLHGGHGGEPGTATQQQVAVNIFISFVGAGMLGMPHAFSRSGWLLGAVILSAASTANIYAMLLLVATRKKLEAQGHTDIFGYGDLGRIISGSVGERVVNICLVISQVGFATAYIIFVAANIYSIAQIDRAYTCFGCVPILAVLVQAKEMKTLSPFSLIADCANLLGLSAVLFRDFESYRYHHEPVKAVDLSSFLYMTAISMYSFEGVGLILPLESSCKDRKAFPSLLKKVILGITALMITFGTCGYLAYGSATEAPVTLNLDGGWATFVKLSLCLALYLTYPIMMFPVNEVIEDMLLSSVSKPSRLFRLSIVFLTALVAYSIPDFGEFLSLVGASICTLLGFIIPCYFHLKVFDWKELPYWQFGLDAFLIVFGFVFGCLGTWDSFKNIVLEDA